MNTENLLGTVTCLLEERTVDLINELSGTILSIFDISLNKTHLGRNAIEYWD